MGRWLPAGRVAERRWRMGSAKAAVLPVPVWRSRARPRPEGERDGLLLDGSGRGVALGLDGAKEGLDQAEIQALRKSACARRLGRARAMRATVRGSARRALGRSRPREEKGAPRVRAPSPTACRAVRPARSGRPCARPASAPCFSRYAPSGPRPRSWAPRVLGELHGELALALGRGAQVRGVAEHRVQRHLGHGVR